MTSSNKENWQSTIFIGEGGSESKIFYGDTLLSLRQSIRDWLTENKPTFFQSTTLTCIYSDGTRPSMRKPGENIEKGWYLRNRGEYYLLVNSPRAFESVLDEFMIKGVLPEKGPDHSDRPPIIEGKLQLHYIKTIRRETDERKANAFLKRGWYIISIDQSVDPDYKSVSSVYVLGHPEEDAI